MEKNTKYKCEFPECTWEGVIRSKIKNKNSEYYGLKCCPMHASQNSGKEKQYYTISKQTEKNKIKRKEKSESLAPFFAYHVKNMSGKRCLFCAARLNASKFNAMHILPKSKYKSVENNLDNCIYGCGEIGLYCHSKFDSNQNNLKWMSSLSTPVITEILKKYNKMLPFITEYGEERNVLDELCEINLVD